MPEQNEFKKAHQYLVHRESIALSKEERKQWKQDIELVQRAFDNGSIGRANSLALQTILNTIGDLSVHYVDDYNIDKEEYKDYLEKECQRKIDVVDVSVIEEAIYREKKNPFNAVFEYFDRERIKNLDLKKDFFQGLIIKIGNGENIKEFLQEAGFSSRNRLHFHSENKDIVPPITVAGAPPLNRSMSLVLKNTGRFANLISPMKHYPPAWLKQQLNEALLNHFHLFNPFQDIEDYFLTPQNKINANTTKLRCKQGDFKELKQHLTHCGPTPFKEIIDRFIKERYENKPANSRFRYLMKKLASYSEAQLRGYFQNYSIRKKHKSLEENIFMLCLTYLDNDAGSDEQKKDIFCRVVTEFNTHKEDESIETLKAKIIPYLTEQHYLKKEFTLFQKIHGGQFANLITRLAVVDESLVNEYQTFKEKINDQEYPDGTVGKRIKENITQAPKPGAVM